MKEQQMLDVLLALQESQHRLRLRGLRRREQYDLEVPRDLPREVDQVRPHLDSQLQVVLLVSQRIIKKC